MCHHKHATSLRVGAPATSLRECLARNRHLLLRRGDCNKLVSMREIVFEITQESDGGFVAECLTESIITQADDWEGLRANVKEAVAAFYFDRPERPSSIRLRLVRDEILASA